MIKNEQNIGKQAQYSDVIGIIIGVTSNWDGKYLFGWKSKPKGLYYSTGISWYLDNWIDCKFCKNIMDYKYIYSFYIGQCKIL